MEITFDNNPEYIAQISDECPLDRHLYLTIPRGHIGTIYVDGRLFTRVQACTKARLVDKISGHRGSMIQVACSKADSEFEILYGDGDIPIKNAKINDTYYVGYSGTMVIELTDIIEIINKFTSKNAIKLSDIRSKLLPTIQSVATPIVAKKFADTNVSLFEINALIGDIREEMTRQFVKEKLFKNMGIDVTSVSIRPFVKESELERIRAKINDADNK